MRSTSFGTVVGSLDSISVHRGREFRVWDEQTTRPVTCSIKQGKQEARAKELLGEKVVVTGMVRADRFGRPVSMTVESVDQFVSPSNWPSIEEMRGLVPNFTGGLSLREFFEDRD